MESPDLLLVVFISFYYTAQQIPFFTKFYHIICKKDFHHKFSSFFDEFTQTPLSHPLNWPKSTKHDKSFLLMLPS